MVELFYLAPGADIANGLYGFSPVLTAIALGCTFYKPSWKTAPFCIATWLFLLPQFQFKSER